MATPSDDAVVGALMLWTALRDHVVSGDNYEITSVGPKPSANDGSVYFTAIGRRYQVVVADMGEISAQ